MRLKTLGVPVLLAIAGATGLVGCSGANEAQERPSRPSTLAETEQAEKSPTPTPAPQANEREAPTLLPACDAANSLAAQESAEFLASTEVTPGVEAGPATMDVFLRLSGPVAQQAIQSGANLQACEWPLYLAGNRVVQYSVILPDGPRADFIQQLRASDYVESSLGPATMFTYSVDDPQGYRMTGSTTIQYLFVEDAWIAIFETGKSDYSQSALAALTALNPGLGE